MHDREMRATWFKSDIADLNSSKGMYATIEEAYAARRAQDAQRICIRIGIELLTDYVRGHFGDEAGGTVADFLANWEDSRLPNHVEMDKLVDLHRSGQDLNAWWTARRLSELPNMETNGSPPRQQPD